MGDRDQWAVVAAVLLRLSGLKSPVDAGLLARACRLTLVKRPGHGAELLGREVHYDAHAGIWERQRQIARCVARWALQACGLDAHDIAIHAVVRALSPAPSLSSAASNEGQ